MSLMRANIMKHYRTVLYLVGTHPRNTRRVVTVEAMAGTELMLQARTK